jgi:hypothetical protein
MKARGRWRPLLLILATASTGCLAAADVVPEGEPVASRRLAGFWNIAVMSDL